MAHWSKGPNADSIRKRLSESKKGNIPWNKGKKFPSEENSMYGKKHSEESIAKMKLAHKKNWETTEHREKQANSHWCRNDNSILIGNKISETKARLISEGKIVFPSNHGYKAGYYVSDKMDAQFYYRSSYELVRLEQLEHDNTVKSFTINHGIRLKYEYNGKLHHYIPDILVHYFDGRIELEEIKGWIRDKGVFNAKCKVAVEYCKNNSMKYLVLFKEDLNI